MKKIIAAAVAFAVVGGIASVASAAVDLSGNARVRFIYTDNMFLVDDSETHLDSRVRINVEAKSAGGAYAKARIRMMDQDGSFIGGSEDSWGTAANSTDGFNSTDKADDRNIYVDYAWLGIPLGNGMTVEGGRMTVNWSRFFSFDNRADRLKLTYKASKTLTVGATYDKNSEGALDAAGDDDKNTWGILAKNKFANGWMGGLRALYVDDNTVADLSGMKGSVFTTGKVGEGKLYAEVAYFEGDLYSSTADSRLGAYVSWNGAVGGMNPEVMLGMTKDGYMADNDFGWIMIGFAEPITAIEKVGVAGGDTTFASISNTFKLSEKSSLTGNLVYMDADDVATVDQSAMEISGRYSYAVSDGASISLSAGYLDTDRFANNPLAAYVSFDVNY